MRCQEANNSIKNFVYFKLSSLWSIHGKAIHVETDRKFLVDMFLHKLFSSIPVDIDGDEALLCPALDQLVDLNDKLLKF